MIRALLTIAPVALLAACSQTASNSTSADMSSANTTDMGAPGMASTDNGTDNAMMPAAMDDATYLAKAGAGDLFEMESSKAIMAKTKDAAVKDFAQEMIKAHTDSTAKVKAAAMKAGLKVDPPKLDAEQQASLDSIKSADGDAANAAYVSAQRDAHSKALMLHQGYAQSGATPALKDTAGAIAKVVQQHIDMLAKLPGA